MNHRQAILDILDAHGGRIATSDVANAGVPTIMLTRLVRDGTLDSPKRGLYQRADLLDDKMWEIQTTYPSIVFSHETALWMHGLSDRTPLNHSVTVPYNFDTTGLRKQRQKIFYVNPSLLEIGLMAAATSPHGKQIRLYDIEHTIVDAFRARGRIDAAILNQAIRDYACRPNKDLLRLNSYARLFRVMKPLKMALQVLL